MKSWVVRLGGRDMFFPDLARSEFPMGSRQPRRNLERSRAGGGGWGVGGVRQSLTRTPCAGPDRAFHSENAKNSNKGQNQNKKRLK